MTIRKSLPWKSLLLTLWVSGAPLAVSSAVIYYALAHESAIRQFGTAEWVAVFAISCLTMGLALTPTTFIALASGYFLGLPALIGVVIGYTGASLIGFSLTQVVDEGQLMKSIYGWLGDERAKRLRRLLAGIADHQFGIIVMARLSPLLPFALMNVVLPVAGVHLRSFLLAGTLGMLPRTAFFVWLGSEAKTLRTLVEEGGAGLLPRLLLIGLLVVSLIGFFYYGRRIVSQRS